MVVVILQGAISKGFSMILIFSGIFLIIYIISLAFEGIAITIAYAALIVICLIYDLIRIKNFVNKTLECLICRHNFKAKWYKLMFFKWRMPKLYRVYVDIDSDNKKLEKLIYKCPICKSRECVKKEA